MKRQYKDSGIPWIGMIPNDWGVGRLKNIKAKKQYAIVDGPFGSAISTDDYCEEGVPLIRIVNLKGYNVDDSTIMHISPKLAEEVNRSSFSINDIIIAKTGATVGKCSINNKIEYGILSSSCVKISFDNNIDNRFYYFFFNTRQFNEALRMSCNGTTRDTINLIPFSNIQCPIPPFPTQQRIADFLDRKCAEIDELAALQETMIAELKRYKQSVITEAVTKGLDPDVPMKDSGVEWIGEIPSHWNETKVLNLLSMPITDGPHETPDLFDSGIPFISADAVSDGYINFDNKRGYISQEYYEECCKKYIPQKYDIYMIKSGASTGRTAIVETDKVFTIWSPLAVFRANTNMILPYYLLYVLRSYGFQKQVETNWSYGTQQNIGMRTLEKLIVSFPSLAEQRSIADHLDQKCAEIDELIAIKQQKIEALKEYKKSVIFEYVTGKKEI